jgi:glycosyltransferase involved in cell wall biosynthesis
MNGFPPEIAITVPAFQAGRWVGQVVRDVLQVAPRLLVIDDGSTDATAQEARAAGGEVVRLELNQGKGNALRLAFETLFGRGYQAVLTLDADGQHLASEIPVLVETWRASGADLVLGTRDHLFAAMSPLRRFSNTLSSRIISTVAGQPMSDIQTGFRIYRRSLIERVGFPEPRFAAESAVIVRALRSGFRVVGVPIHLARVDGRSSSHYRPLVDSWRIARAVTRARFERRTSAP